MEIEWGFGAMQIDLNYKKIIQISFEANFCRLVRLLAPN